MALTNLERFVAASPTPEATLDAPGRATPRTTEILVQLFSTSQYFSELMIRDPVAARLAPRRAPSAATATR